VPNVDAPNYIENTTVLTSIDRLQHNSGRLQYKILSNCSDRPRKFYREPSELMDTIDKMDLTDIWSISSPTEQYTFFSSVHGTFNKTANVRNLKELPVFSQIIWNKTRLQ
jgi:hypothetical protein